MDSFKEIKNLISEDIIQNRDPFFYSRIKQRIIELEQNPGFVFKIKKSHIIYSIAAGLLLGLFVGRIVQYQILEHKRVFLMETVLNDCHLNELNSDCYEACTIMDMFKNECS